jgi:hypothetical protein
MHTRIEQFLEGVLEDVRAEIVEDDGTASVEDPVFRIRRNRVNAEVAKALFRLHRYDTAQKLIAGLLRTQNGDGSWNEIHPQYNSPSALVTSFVGDALLCAYEIAPEEQALRRARGYVMAQEQGDGYFLKSVSYTADHLNVDASCGAFLAEYGLRFSDRDCLDAAARAADRICRHQAPDGSYPYTTDQGNYAYPMTVPCIHYQGVTMYYLAKIHRVLGEERIEESLLRGGDWLRSVQGADGSFDWSRSGLMFAYYLSGAYAFAFSSFAYLAEIDRDFCSNAARCLDRLEDTTRGLVLRWETDAWETLPADLLTTAKTAGIGDFPLTHRTFRFGYGMYRQIARRRVSGTVNPAVFRLLSSAMNIKASTVEPSTNYPDAFMTAEVLDCLSHTYANGATIA